MAQTTHTIEGDGAVIGAVRIDWTKREITLHGAAGDQANALDMAGLATLIAQAGEGVEVRPFVLWPENADGYPQLEFRAFDVLTADEDQGWDLFNEGPGTTELQRDDELGIFPDDESAWRYVHARAVAGSVLHKQALQTIQDTNPEEYARIMAEVAR